MMLDKSTLMLKHYGTDDIEKIKALKEEDQRAGGNLSVEELVKMPFPYYAPSDSLPPIPTAEDVENAQDPEYLKSDRADCAVGHVYRVNTVYAVKFSRSQMLLQEAENLLFLQEHEVRTLKVYAVFSHQGADPLGIMKRSRRPRSSLPKYYYLVMDFVDGVALDDEMWEDLTVEAREKIYDKIGEQLQLLRSIPPPTPSYYGRVNGQPYHPNYFIIGHRRRCPVGPFNTYEAFLKQAYNTFEVNFIFQLIWNTEINPVHRLWLSNFVDCFEKSSESGVPKLSHMDLKVENMMLAPSASNSSNRIEDYDLWLLDWEFMSWLPAWAEAAGAIMRLPRSETEKFCLGYWGVSRGIKPFYWAQADFYNQCTGQFGGRL